MGIFIIEMNFYGIESSIERMTEHHFGPFPWNLKTSYTYTRMYMYINGYIKNVYVF